MSKIPVYLSNHQETREPSNRFSLWARFSFVLLAVLGLTAQGETIGSRHAYAHSGKMGWSEEIHSGKTRRFGEGFINDAQDSQRAEAAAQATTSPPSRVTSTITKDGITWTFERPVPVGEFVTGDYYV